MKSTTANDKPVRLRGGWWGPVLVLLFVLTAGSTLYAYYVYPHTARTYGFKVPFNEAMFGCDLKQPISFSHRVHATDKHIDCFYCHSYPERSLNAGLPSADKCLGCHNYIIPQHQEILKLKAFKAAGQDIPWVRVYYNPDHVFFPHYRHIGAGLACQECHGEVETADRLRQVTFYMGLCINCHTRKKAPKNCANCHQ